MPTAEQTITTIKQAIADYEATPAPVPTPTPTPSTESYGQFIHGVYAVNGQWIGRWSKDKLKLYVDEGYTHFRVGTFWQHIEPVKGQFNEQYLKTLDTLVADIGSLGATCYFDVIHMYKSGGVEQGIPGWAKTEVNATADTKKHSWAYLQHIARRYQNNPTVTGYDINEPDDWQSANNVLSMHDTAIKAIRQIDTAATKKYYLEPSYGNGDPTNGDPNIITDKRNVVLSVHDYFMGWDSTGKAVYGYDGVTGWANKDATHLEKWLATRKAWADKAGIPLEVGEWGIGIDAANRDAWIAAKKGVFTKLRVKVKSWWEARSANNNYRGLSGMDSNFGMYTHIKAIPK